MGRHSRIPHQPSKPRPGVPMTDAEYNCVLAWAAPRKLTFSEAIRQLVAKALDQENPHE